MSKSNVTSISYFLREELKQEQVVEVPGIKTFCDEEGNPVPFKIRELGSEEINKLREGCKTRRMAKDKKGKPVIINGTPQWIEEYDSALITNTLIARALVFPDLHDEQLLSFYGVYDAVSAVNKVFRRIEDYRYISEQVMEVCGLNDNDDDENVETIKN